MSASSSDVFQEARSGGSDAEFTECLETSDDIRRLECHETSTPLQDPGVLELEANNSFRE